MEGSRRVQRNDIRGRWKDSYFSKQRHGQRTELPCSKSNRFLSSHDDHLHTPLLVRQHFIPPTLVGRVVDALTLKSCPQNVISERLSVPKSKIVWYKHPNTFSHVRHEQERQGTYNLILRRVREKIFAVENDYCGCGVCVCSLSYPAGKARAPYYIVVCGLSCSTTFFHIIS